MANKEKKNERLIVRLNLDVQFERDLWERYNQQPRTRRQEFMRGVLRRGLNSAEAFAGAPVDGDHGYGPQHATESGEKPTETPRPSAAGLKDMFKTSVATADAKQSR